MPKTKQQFEELRNQKIELIESVALNCFAQRGFHQTSMDTIAKEAGISTGLTYNYFSSKDELLKRIYIKGISKVFADAKDSGSTEEKFIAFILRIFNEMKSNASFWKLYFIVMGQPEIQSMFQKHIMEALAPVLGMLVDYFKERGMENPVGEAQYLFSTLDGICINYLLNEEKYPLEFMKEKILNSYVR